MALPSVQRHLPPCAVCLRGRGEVLVASPVLPAQHEVVGLPLSGFPEKTWMFSPLEEGSPLRDFLP